MSAWIHLHILTAEVFLSCTPQVSKPNKCYFMARTLKSASDAILASSPPACWPGSAALGRQRRCRMPDRQCCGLYSAPAARTSASRSSLRYEMARSAPSRANMSAAARPMPESPPVISAICTRQHTPRRSGQPFILPKQSCQQARWQPPWAAERQKLPLCAVQQLQHRLQAWAVSAACSPQGEPCAHLVLQLAVALVIVEPEVWGWVHPAQCKCRMCCHVPQSAGECGRFQGVLKLTRCCAFPLLVTKQRSNTCVPVRCIIRTLYML